MAQKRKNNETLTMVILVVCIALLLIGAAWGNIAYYVAGWDKALSLKEKWEIWFYPTLTCVLPGVVLYFWYKIREGI